MKRQCTANVACDFCKARSHATLACRTYANFVKEHPLTSSRKNTLERFHNELDVNIEVARRVEFELRKWKRENGPKGKPPLPQSRKQQTVNSQQYLSQEPAYSQDIRVQMGEEVHTESHQSQHVKNGKLRYHPTIKVNYRFIAKNGRTNERCPPDQTGRDSFSFEPKRFQPMIKANNCFITEDSRTNERGSLEQLRGDPVACKTQRLQ